MPLKNHYFYDEEQCEFIPVRYAPVDQFVYNAAVWILSGVVLAGLGIILLSTYIGTPSEIALKAENEFLVSQIEETRKTLGNIDSELEKLSEKDNQVYRSILGLEKISDEELMAGVGGSGIASEIELLSKPVADIIEWTSSKLNQIERRVNIQNLSLEEIKEHYNINKEKLKHIPAIKPTPGILLSGFGNRYHPILNYRRMHNGLDFRADVGSSVYATGDGKVLSVGRNGNLGLTVVVSHGYGYETLYAHLNSVPSSIKKGAKVVRGQLLAYSGDSGLAEGPHLHYEIHLNGKPVDPVNYLFADISPEEYKLFKEISLTNQKSLD